MDEKKLAKRSSMKVFIKMVNYNHLMPTRYTLDIDLKGTVAPDAVDSKDKRKKAALEAKKMFEERFKTGKNRWFFAKLRF